MSSDFLSFEFTLEQFNAIKVRGLGHVDSVDGVR